MASSRPSGFSSGGGFLNNVDGTLTGGEFWTAEELWPGKTKKRDDGFIPLYYQLALRVDGAKKDITVRLFAGGEGDWQLSDDRRTLEPLREGAKFPATSELGAFVTAMVEQGFPEEELPEDVINYEAFDGYRVRFIQVPKLDKATGKQRTRTPKTGAYAGRTFNDTFTSVGAVYGKEASAATAAPTKKAAGATRTAVAVSKANGKGKGPDLFAETTASLLALLGEASDGTLLKAKLPVLLGRYCIKAGKTTEQLEEMRKLIYNDEFLERANGWVYDPESQTITLTQNDIPF